jgi:WD40 repeat protein
VYGLAFAPDGKLLASCGGDKTARLWEVATGKELRRIPQSAQSARSVAFAPDGKTSEVAWSDYGQHWEDGRGGVGLFEVATGRALRRLGNPTRPLEAVAFAPDGKTVAAVGGHDSTVHLWDVATGRERRGPDGHQGFVGSIAFAADGRRVVTSGGDETVRLWDGTTGEQLQAYAGWAGRLTADGRTLVIVGGPEGTVARVLDAVTGRERRRFPLPAGNPYGAAVSPDGRALAQKGDGHALTVWDLDVGKERCRLEVDKESPALAVFAPDGGRLASAGHQDKTVRVWDLTTRKALRQFAYGGPSLAFSLDGTLLAGGGADQADEGVRVWDVDAGKEVLHLAGDEGHGLRSSSVAFSPDGRVLACGCINGQARLYEVATGKFRLAVEGHPEWTPAPALSPDGRLLATGNGDTTALVWDLCALAGVKKSLTDEALPRLWDDLISADAAVAYRAILQLSAVPQKSVPLLRSKLKPAPRGDARRIARLIAELDSEDFAVREKATKALEEFGEAAVDELRKVLAGSPSAEVRRRAEGLVEKWGGTLLSGERLRTQRALEALEHAGTAEARRVLEALAGGQPGAALTRGAQGALRRLDGQPRMP